jgi:hypothetical protein
VILFAGGITPPAFKIQKKKRLGAKAPDKMEELQMIV